MDEYKSYLAAAIFSEERVVTYRLLSRALKINVNLAKEMLYDFHRVQNGKKPGTVYATYLVSGIKRKNEPTATNGDAKKDGEDDYMQSSPFMPSSMPQPEENGAEVTVLSITLTGEDNLKNLRSQYESISSIHVYSLGPHPLKDLQILSDVTREVQEVTINDDALLTISTYGSITNKNVKRRVGRARLPAVPASVPALKSAPVKSKANSSQEAAKTTNSASKSEPKSQTSGAAKDFFGKSSGAASTSKVDPAPAVEKKAPATLKKEASSIFKSFAKAKPKLKREGTDTSASASAAVSAAEDEPMRGMSSDDDDDDEPLPPPVAKPAPTDLADKNRQSRKEREAALKKMMDEEEDEEETPAPDPTSQVSEMDEEPTLSRADSRADSKTEKEREKEVPPAVSDGRRRGRRRVMKKKTMKDDEGYLVTKEEAVWESFSEEEPAVPKPKAAVTTTAKAKKAPAKPGQGSIMSFFGKK
ncbi:DNA polymerase delta subunit 3 [Phlyctema vagabunda]|uniref:DNA polymerase delta subunit 3 n=1 Tax=Phlyctema vagabunda TaxID=108571 RepID=A0ABR4PRP7_9HELO